MEIDYAILRTFHDQESGLSGSPPGTLLGTSDPVRRAGAAKIELLCKRGYLKAVESSWRPAPEPEKKPATPWTSTTLGELTKEQIQEVVAGADPSVELHGTKADFIAQALEVLG